jgi:hypothetical protein
MCISNWLKSFIIFLLISVVVSCSSKQEPDAQQIVDKAIQVHGGEKFSRMAISFRLRDKQYRALRDYGAYVYSRTFTDSTGQQVYDVLQNSGFERKIDGKVVEISDEKAAAYGASINSVIYFALLPYFLNDAAVVKEYIGESTVKGKPYRKVKVTFKPEGGGEDFDDVYVFWFHKEDNTLDYLAYSFIEDGGGTRFREAKNAREVGGIRVQDYINYTTKENITLDQYDTLFEAGKLEKVSEINLEEIQVTDLPGA